jgi:hypothetical protein
MTMCARCKYKDLVMTHDSPTSGESEEGKGATEIFAKNTKGSMVSHRALRLVHQCELSAVSF